MNVQRQPDVQSSTTTIDRARFQRITIFFARVIANLIWWDILLKRMIPSRVLASRPRRWRKLARQFRGLAVEMGGVLIKLGQFLSSRVDVLPPEITEELKGLQDEVPPVDAPVIRAALERELGNLSRHFVSFEAEPLAAASLGQVHRAWLPLEDPSTNEPPKRGMPVVVKVQRPGIVQLVQTDLAALRVVARWMMRYRPIRRRADMPALLEEFARTLWEELDYEQEADNAERFAEMFAEDEDVYIPSVFRQHSTRRVLVLENVEAIKILDVEAIEAAGISRAEVAERLLDTYFKQIFEAGFFHADPHPGNLFIQPSRDLTWEPDDGPRPFRLIFVDFGMVGHIDAGMSENLRKVLISVTQRDARGLTEAYQDLGFFLPGADFERIVEAQAILLDELWGRKLLELAKPDPAEVQRLTREFRDILFDFPFQVPQDFIYLGRTLGILSGLASLLHPEINPWYQIEKYGRAVIRRSALRQLDWEKALNTLESLATLPFQLQRVLLAAEQGRLQVQATTDRATAERLERIERRLGQLQISLFAAVGVISGLLLYLTRRKDNDEE